MSDAVCRFMISQHPEVEKKVLEELDRLELLATPQRRRPRPMTYDDLAALSCTSAAIKVTDNTVRCQLPKSASDASSDAAGVNAHAAGTERWHKPHDRVRCSCGQPPAAQGNDGLDTLQRHVQQPK